MNKILLIIQREYLSRVKKKSFIVMTILGPILIAAIYTIPFYLAKTADEKKEICVVDEAGLFYNQFTNTSSILFKYSEDLEKGKQSLSKGDFSGIIYIPKQTYAVPSEAFMLYSKDQPSMMIQHEIENQMQTLLRNNVLLQAHNISKEDYDLINKTKITLRAQDVQTGKSSMVEVKTVLAFAMGFLIYMFIFMFGSQVMNGVMEEKTSRIVEIMVSSVRPFQLMMGKIIGIALVGLTQFLLWVVLSAGLLTIGGTALLGDSIKNMQTEQLTMTKLPSADTSQIQAQPKFDKIIEEVMAIDYTVMLTSFLFYFLLGYLFYATLFASIGSIVESQSDSQQFMLPVTVPLIIALIMSTSVINNPSGPVAFWFSMIPFTSPVIMLMRIPFGVPYWQIALSIGILIISFIGTTWLSGKIYRTGILMYGKKITYGELWKWIKYKN